jgi:leucyl-tRNA synthetase
MDAVRAHQSDPQAVRRAEVGPAERALRRKTHQCIQKLRRDLSVDLHFNTAISALKELVNDCSEYLREHAPAAGNGGAAGKSAAQLVVGEALHALVLLLGPMAPHICEEIWEELGHADGILAARFPELDPAALEVDSVTLIVQVNGKVRARIEVPTGSPEAEIERLALAHPHVATHLSGRAPRKVIVVADKLVNVVG